jgi:hypothetical protein
MALEKANGIPPHPDGAHHAIYGPVSQKRQTLKVD